MDSKLISYVMGEAAKSNIEKRQVGALIVAHHEDGTWDIVGRGYNTEEVHAENMACEDLFNNEYSKPEQTVLVCYVTHQPCPTCANLLAEHGVSRTELVEAFMKFDGDKVRYDLVDPDFALKLYNFTQNELLSSGSELRLRYSLRSWQQKQVNAYLLTELVTYYNFDIKTIELEIAEVLTFGARKYKPNNWRKCVDTGRYLAAALRHLDAIERGEEVDPESGLKHRAHLATNVMFLYVLGYNNEY